MPEESKGPESASPVPEGAKAPAEAPVPPKTEAQPQAAAAEVKTPPAAAAAPVGASEAKPADAAKAAAPAAKPAAPAAAKPAAPAKPAGPVPESWTSELVRSLKQQYGSGIEALSYLGQKYLTVDATLLPEILLRMHDSEGFDYCVDITAVHYPKREQQFEMVYVLYSFTKNERIRVKARITDGEHVQSSVAIWPTADWLEREVFDMFGIVFDGHPGLKRILLPDGWKGHPLRKDYDILLQDKEWVQINLGIESGQ
jgi:NADH-quinone oxidoreductase subunit C